MVRPILIQIPESQQIVVDRDLSHFNLKNVFYIHVSLYFFLNYL